MRKKKHIKEYLQEKGFSAIDSVPDFATEKHQRVAKIGDVKYSLKKEKDLDGYDKKIYFVLIGRRTLRFAYLNNRKVNDEKLERMVREAVVKRDPKQVRITDMAFNNSMDEEVIL